MVAALETALMYLSAGVVKEEQGFYNKLQAHMVAFWWLDEVTESGRRLSAVGS